jgi:hypothetical protein
MEKQKNKIHFAALYCIDFDFPMAEQWANHYRAFDFDSYKIFLHTNSGDIKKMELALAFFKKKGFHVEQAIGKFKDGALRETYLNQYAETLDDNDYLVTADSDELQVWPIPGPEIREQITGNDIVLGNLIDRYSFTLRAISEASLLSQFPLEGIVEHQILFRLREEQRNEWPLQRRTKIVAARADFPVQYSGSHGVSIESENVRAFSGITVYHFCWHENAEAKLKTKSYYPQWTIDEINRFFGRW